MKHILKGIHHRIEPSLGIVSGLVVLLVITGCFISDRFGAVQNFKNIPSTIAQSTVIPKIAPVRVAKITSPEPIYSAAHTIEGPKSAKTASPTGAFLILISLTCSVFSSIAFFTPLTQIPLSLNSKLHNNLSHRLTQFV